MKKFLIICGVVALIIATIFILKNQNKYFNSAIAVMCVGEEYTEIDNIGYLTIVFDNEKATRKTLPVKDKKLKKELSASNIDDIIGANIFLQIPYRESEGKHLNIDSLNSIDLILSTSEYDRYCEIAGVSYK